MSDGYEYDPYDEIVEWELYAMREGLTDEELQEILRGDRNK